MLSATTALLLSALLTFAMILFSAAIRTRLWTVRGFSLAAGNRDDLPAPTALQGRADRAAKNMIENLVMFVAVVAAVVLAGKENATSALGATIFFWARVAYWPAYLIGITYLRTALWTVGVVGMFLVGSAAL